MGMEEGINGAVLRLIRDALRERADPVRAAGMQAYMKSTQPSLGVRVPEVRRVVASAVAAAPFATPEQLRATVLELWRTAGAREERYAAIDLTGGRLVARDLQMLPVYQEVIRSGAWWDFADGVSGRLFLLLQAHRPEMTAVLQSWSRDADFWIRRASITAQLKAKEATDTALLTQVIEPNLANPDFFIRKAIGWALREYAKTAPEWVAAFVAEHASRMSPLSRREALRRIGQDSQS